MNEQRCEGGRKFDSAAEIYRESAGHSRDAMFLESNLEKIENLSRLCSRYLKTTAVKTRIKSSILLIGDCTTLLFIFFLYESLRMK